MGRRKERLEETARVLDSLNSGATKILPVPADTTVEDDMKHVYEQINKTFGRTADVVMANAAAVSGIKPLGDEAVSEWWKVYVSTVRPSFPFTLQR